ncbi:MAG: HlyD family efflux transporter periplasmic adaptor subunit [Planctomycetaceae bacterium]
MGPSKRDFTELVTKPAEKKRFQISLSAQGYLDSLGNVTLASGVEGATTIIKIVPEGTIVKKGDVVCQLDSSSLRERAKQQEITVKQSDSAVLRAKTTLEDTTNMSKRDIEAIKVRLDVAGRTLKKYIEGEYPQQLNDLEASIELANEELVRATENYEFTKLQVKKGYRTQNELEANRIAKKQAVFKVKSALDRKKVLENYDRQTREVELTRSVEQLKLELESAEKKAVLSKNQAENDLKTQELTNAVEHDKYKRLLTQIEACSMKAPQAGQVVYAVNKNARGGGDQIEQGATVRERQAIINLPDVSQMKVDCRIHESMIGNIRKGLPASVRINAFADQVFNGVISDVSSVPIPGRWPNMDLKEYETEIKLTDGPEVIQKLRPGLTAQVEVLVDSRDDVLQIPLTAVLAIADKQFAYVLTDKGEELRELVTGQSNQSHVEIKEGLKDGELVIMNSRTQFPDQIAALETKLTEEKVKQAINISKSKGSPPPEQKPNSEAAPAANGNAAPPGGTEGTPRPAEQGGGGGDRGEIFNRLDKNGDGKIQSDEMDDRMKSRAADIDKDGDGAISKEEFMNAPRPRRDGNGAPAAG